MGFMYSTDALGKVPISIGIDKQRHVLTRFRLDCKVTVYLSHLLNTYQKQGDYMRTSTRTW